jgi:5-formyltetrahydrofolate cyclo-ligase
MKNKELIELLNDHAEALNMAKSRSQILAEHPMEYDGELASLFQLAEEVKDVLVPVPVPAFREELRRRLESYELSNVTIGSPTNGRKQKLIIFAMTGSTLSVVGLLFVLLRRLRSSGDESARPITNAV